MKLRQPKLQVVPTDILSAIITFLRRKGAGNKDLNRSMKFRTCHLRNTISALSAIREAGSVERYTLMGNPVCSQLTHHLCVTEFLVPIYAK